MQVVRNVDRCPRIRHPVMTIGNFDGVHLGHQALLKKVIEDAKSRGGASVVLTFDPHPLKIIAPQVAPRLILTRRDRLGLLRDLGIDFTIIQKFTPAFYNLSADDFIRRYVYGIGVCSIWVGRDFRFGKGRAGTIGNLLSWSYRKGFEVKIIEEIVASKRRISSSRIRELIETGDVNMAHRYLGRYHFILGRVVQGHRRGREFGFPTANLLTVSEVVPAEGIYATFVEFGGECFPSVTSIGWNPTFGEGPKTIETHILGFNGELYGRKLRLFFIDRLRGEKKFESVELLAAQIRQDVIDARRVFDRAIEENPGLLDMLDKEAEFT
jgi:riboflavin kinase/FMN adenylyltransferase